MKNITQYITESSGASETTVYFPNIASWFIFEAELSGQISDGYWENSRPYDHWKWISNVTPKIDKEKIGYDGVYHRLKYSTTWLRRYVKKALKGDAGDYNWTIRVFKYAKFASLFKDSDLNKLEAVVYDLETIIENLPEEPVTIKEFEASLKDWHKKYFEKVKSIVTDKVLKQYYDSQYDWNDFEDDLDAATEAINTHI